MSVADEVWMIVRLLMICDAPPEADGEVSQTCVTLRRQMAAGISSEYSSTNSLF